ncbi:MAG TPA: tRNA uridine-5-carboxymethylaminomethyl(34) synthesis GTPase MnmE [Thermoanaerobaculia bacterium]|nr:tRNA uridine-5-carboxymethylaminomethyl(34) synthesis GTPase MnmE [Thermoanaerobaculia bacterium]
MTASSSHPDTIVAPATALARSALAIVRIDGPLSATIITSLTGILPEERYATHIALKSGGELLDDCIVLRYVAPRSFTGNDMVELMLHGSPFLVDRVIGAIVALGARVAEPGEFTERAVLNGKIDLLQAESIADLIDARTAVQAKLSLRNLEGVLSRKASETREALLHVISRLEAALDFSEEGYEFITREDARARVEAARDDVRMVAATFERGRATATGLSAVILGRPNAGKSTLLNRLVGSERAIVTAQPGTTRDIVRETIDIGGLPVTIADTAGLRATRDEVEEIGIARAKAAARSADLVLYLVDASAGVAAEDHLEEFPDALIVYTKSDIARAPAGELAISAATGAGVDELLSRLDSLVRERFAAPESSPAIVNERQRAAVAECEAALDAALASLAEGAEEQYVVVDLYRAANALGILTGAITREDVFREIFSKFCIGK